MIIWIDDYIFSGFCRDVDCIVLLRNAASRKHTLIISEYVGQEYNSRKSPYFEKWFDFLPQRLKNEIKILLEICNMVSANSAAHGASISILISDRVNISKRKVCQLSLTEAIRAISLPLYIMVENQINDGAFLRHVLPPLWRSRIIKWEQSGELRFLQGGGNSEITRLIEFHSDNEKSKLTFGLPSEVWRLTHFVIYDHDGDSENVPGIGAAILDTLCREKKIFHHRLNRRTQEHYLPFEVLKEITNIRITDLNTKKTMLDELENHSKLGEIRHFKKLPKIGDSPFFKNEFTSMISWNDELAEKDAMWPEMINLAEKIAAAV